jgi:putative ABC transport system permease protein
MALKAALIPITNSLFAVGLVFLPGLMTGQILSGVPPLIAARYQIMVMCMTFSSAGLSSACFLMLIKSKVQNINPGEHAAHGGVTPGKNSKTCTETHTKDIFKP